MQPLVHLSYLSSVNTGQHLLLLEYCLLHDSCITWYITWCQLYIEVNWSMIPTFVGFNIYWPVLGPGLGSISFDKMRRSTGNKTRIPSCLYPHLLTSIVTLSILGISGREGPFSSTWYQMTIPQFNHSCLLNDMKHNYLQAIPISKDTCFLYLISLFLSVHHSVIINTLPQAVYIRLDSSTSIKKEIKPGNKKSSWLRMLAQPSKEGFMWHQSWTVLYLYFSKGTIYKYALEYLIYELK